MINAENGGSAYQLITNSPITFNWGSDRSFLIVQLDGNMEMFLHLYQEPKNAFVTVVLTISSENISPAIF